MTFIFASLIELAMVGFMSRHEGRTDTKLNHMQQKVIFLLFVLANSEARLFREIEPSTETVSWYEVANRPIACTNDLIACNLNSLNEHKDASC